MLSVRLPLTFMTFQIFLSNETYPLTSSDPCSRGTVPFSERSSVWCLPFHCMPSLVQIPPFSINPSQSLFLVGKSHKHQFTLASDSGLKKCASSWMESHHDSDSTQTRKANTYCHRTKLDGNLGVGLTYQLQERDFVFTPKH